MDTTWIIAADAGRARIFAQNDPAQPLHEIDDMVNSGARMRVSEQLSDKGSPTAAGASMHSTGGATPTKQYEPQQTVEERDSELFARAICTMLLKGHQEGKYKKLALIAEPKFLGVLRGILDPQLKPLVSQEINKDYTQFSGHQLREQLRSLNARH